MEFKITATQAMLIIDALKDKSIDDENEINRKMARALIEELLEQVHQNFSKKRI